MENGEEVKKSKLAWDRIEYIKDTLGLIDEDFRHTTEGFGSVLKCGDNNALPEFRRSGIERRKVRSFAEHTGISYHLFIYEESDIEEEFKAAVDDYIKKQGDSPFGQAISLKDKDAVEEKSDGKPAKSSTSSKTENKKNKSTTSRISNLPRRKQSFVGRTRELKKLKKLLSRKNRNGLISITGPGGVGKTALALETAHKLLEKNIRRSGEDDREGLGFDAFIWTSAKTKHFHNDKILERESREKNLAHITNRIIKELKPNHKRLPALEEREVALKLLERNRVLLIIDNMETIEDDQVELFLKEIPDPSKALITDRRSLQESNPIRLKPLGDEEAAKFIREQLPRKLSLDDEKINFIREETGGNPQAIHWAVRQVSIGVKPEILFKRLKNRGGELLEFLFGESFKWISKKSKKILLSLSCIDMAATGKMLAEWTDLEDDDAACALTELWQHALVININTEEPERSVLDRKDLKYSYKLIPLIGTFTRFMEKHSEELEEIRRTICYYMLGKLKDVEQNPILSSKKTLDFVGRFHKIIAWTMEDAFDRKDYLFVCSMMWLVGDPLGVRGHNRLRLKLGNLAVESAVKVNLNYDAAWNLIYHVAWSYFQWYELDECEKMLNDGLKRAEKIDNEMLKGLACRNLGLVYKENKKLAEAEEYLEKAKNAFKRIEDRYFLAMTYGSIGSLKRDLGEIKESQDYLFDAIEMAENIGNSEELLTTCYGKLTGINIRLDNIKEAEKYNRKSAEINKVLKRYLTEAYIKKNFALIEGKKGNMDKALAYIEESSHMFNEYGDKKDVESDLDRIREKTKQPFFET